MTNQHDEHHDQTSLVHLLKGDSPICIECGRDMSTKMDEQTETDDNGASRISGGNKGVTEDLPSATGTAAPSAIQEVLNYCRVHYGSNGISDEYEEELKARVEAWSRQQTAEVLDDLKAHKIAHYTAARTQNTKGCVLITEIDAELAALRVGLEGKHGDSK